VILCVESASEVESIALACLAGPGPVEPSRVGPDRAQRGGYVAGWGVPNLTSINHRALRKETCQQQIRLTSIL